MKGLIYKQLDFFCKNEIIGYGGDTMYVIEITAKYAKDYIKKNHYSKKFVPNSYIHLGIYIGKKIVGVLQYGYSMQANTGNMLVTGLKNNEYLELNRMFLIDNIIENAESMAISFSIKYIKNKYKKIKLIQSFADERCKCFGIVYQAANFGYYGFHLTDFYEFKGILYHSFYLTIYKNAERYDNTCKMLQENKDSLVKHTYRQFRYIYFIDKRFEKKCNLKKMPNIKHYNI